MKLALIVIDVQESFRHRPYFSERLVPDFLKNQNALIAVCQHQEIPIVRVFHAEGAMVDSNPFARKSGFVRPFNGLADFDAAFTVEKSRHSALVGTGLDVWLIQQGIQKLMISGIRTEQCCETTTRHASDLGWQVDFALDATLTFDMMQANGQTLLAADIQTRTATVLEGRFARVRTTQDILKEGK